MSFGKTEGGWMSYEHSRQSPVGNDYVKERARVARRAAESAERKTKSSKWDTNILIFLFAVLIIILILLFEDVVLEVVAPIAFLGLAMVWLVGWRQGKQLYNRYYDEELSRLSEYIRLYDEELSHLSQNKYKQNREQTCSMPDWKKSLNNASGNGV